MRILAAALLAVAIAASNAFATAQVPDKIFYEGKKYDMQTNPMESFFNQHPEKRPKSEIESTALWRGYLATFEILDQSLVLKDIEIKIFTKTAEGKRDYSWQSVKTTLVPDGQALQIDWFTGILVLPFGELKDYVHMGYGSTFSNYILLEMKNGKRTGERKLDVKQYEQFKEKQFQAFKKTPEYKKHVAEMQQQGDSQEDIDSLLRSFIVDYTSKFLDEEESPKSMGTNHDGLVK